VQHLGADVGALSREYFYKAMTCIITDNYNNVPLFEGEVDHKIPSPDIILLRDGIFDIIGQFIGYACLHTGLGFIGLSSAVVSYLTAEEIDHTTSFPISLQDIPDFDVRQLLIAVH